MTKNERKKLIDALVQDMAEKAAEHGNGFQDDKDDEAIEMYDKLINELQSEIKMASYENIDHLYARIEK